MQRPGHLHGKSDGRKDLKARAESGSASRGSELFRKYHTQIHRILFNNTVIRLIGAGFGDVGRNFTTPRLRQQVVDGDAAQLQPTQLQ